MKKKTAFRWAIFLFLFLPLFSGCAGKGKGVKTIEGDPEPLYKQALALFNKKDYAEALKKFDQLKSNFPDSPPYTILTELKIADCHFSKKEYVEALAEYEEFKKVHPTHEEIPYVQYQIGMSYFNQMRPLDRDQISTSKALASFEYLVANYSPSLFTQKGKEKVEICKKRLADHEFYIADFYYGQEKFQAAAWRFEGLLANFPKNPGEDKTLFLLGRSYLQIGQEEKAREAFNRILSEYPRSSHFREAKAILDHGVKAQKVSIRKTREKETKAEKKTAEVDPTRVALVKFEEEGKQPIPIKEEKKIEGKKAEEEISSLPSLPASGESVRSISPQKDVRGITPPSSEYRMQGEPPQAIPQVTRRREKSNEDVKIWIPPGQEPPKDIPLSAKSQIETKSGEGKKVAALPGPPVSVKEKQKKGSLPGPAQEKVVDTSKPIDITSDRVETYSKENLIIFKGNVMARQKDMVIYADSLEAVIIEEGKGIEKITAGGNVKIQQGLRVANCQKAVFYNLDQKVVLTGDPRIQEGDNVVSGDEIVFDIDRDQVEVKGGASGRGKAKIHPGEFEKPK